MIRISKTHLEHSFIFECLLSSTHIMGASWVPLKQTSGWIHDALFLLQSKKTYLFEPYAKKKEVQHHPGLFGKRRQCVPGQDILLDPSYLLNCNVLWVGPNQWASIGCYPACCGTFSALYLQGPQSLNDPAELPVCVTDGVACWGQ